MEQVQLADSPALLLTSLHAEILAGLSANSPEFRVLMALEKAIEALSPRTSADGLRRLAMRNVPRGRKSADSFDYQPGRVPLSQRDAAQQVLVSKGEPLGIKELLIAVQAAGARVGGARPQATLSSNLSQDPRFVLVYHNGRQAWWLADLPHGADAAAAA